MAATSDEMVSPTLFIPPEDIKFYTTGVVIFYKFKISLHPGSKTNVSKFNLNKKAMCRKISKADSLPPKSLSDLLLTLSRVRTCHKPVKEVDAEQHEKVIEELIWRNT